MQNIRSLQEVLNPFLFIRASTVWQYLYKSKVIYNICNNISFLPFISIPVLHFFPSTQATEKKSIHLHNSWMILTLRSMLCGDFYEIILSSQRKQLDSLYNIAITRRTACDK